VRRGHRFLAYSLGTLAAASAAGRLVTRRDGKREDPGADEPLGAIRGEPSTIVGPGGGRLYTERFPGKLHPGSGPVSGTLLLTHGWCMTEAAWHYQKRDLAGDRFALVTWDLPGHGHSEALPRDHLSLDHAADALAGVIDAHSEGDVVMVGHSFGGAVTIRYLAMHAETAKRRVRGIVLVSTPLMHVARAVAGRWPWAGIEARVLAGVLERAVRNGFTDRVLSRDVGRREVGRLSYRVVRVGFGDRPLPSHVRFMRDVIASVPAEVRADTFRTMNGYDARPDLDRIAVPALVVAGARDRLMSPADSVAMASRLRWGRHLLLPEAGHAVFIEAHEALNDAVSRFARRRLALRRRQYPRSSGAGPGTSR
jgi:pimeloyl-ACP methyl ester carboxylesterase